MLLTSLVAAQSTIHPGPDLPGQVTENRKSIRCESLIVTDPQGTSYVMVGIIEGSPGVLISDGEGKPRIILNIANDGTAGLSLYDQQNGNRRVSLATSSNGPGLDLFDKDGELKLSLAESKDNPILMMYQNGVNRLRLGVDWLGQFGTSYLSFFSEEAKTQASLWGSQGVTTFSLHNKDGKALVSLGLVEDRPDLTLHDKEGNILFTAPTTPPKKETNA